MNMNTMGGGSLGSAALLVVHDDRYFAKLASCELP